MNRILSRALALVHTVIEYASIDGGRIIVGVRPWTSFGVFRQEDLSKKSIGN